MALGIAGSRYVSICPGRIYADGSDGPPRSSLRSCSTWNIISCGLDGSTTDSRIRRQGTLTACSGCGDQRFATSRRETLNQALTFRQRPLYPFQLQLRDLPGEANPSLASRAVLRGPLVTAEQEQKSAMVLSVSPYFRSAVHNCNIDAENIWAYS